METASAPKEIIIIVKVMAFSDNKETSDGFEPSEIKKYLTQGYHVKEVHSVATDSGTYTGMVVLSYLLSK